MAARPATAILLHVSPFNLVPAGSLWQIQKVAAGTAAKGDSGRGP